MNIKESPEDFSLRVQTKVENLIKTTNIETAYRISQIKYACSQADENKAEIRFWSLVTRRLNNKLYTNGY